jgi:hypothetical protein
MARIHASLSFGEHSVCPLIPLIPANPRVPYRFIAEGRFQQKFSQLLGMIDCSALSALG